jgi:hypothetical protein
VDAVLRLGTLAVPQMQEWVNNLVRQLIRHYWSELRLGLPAASLGAVCDRSPAELV